MLNHEITPFLRRSLQKKKKKEKNVLQSIDKYDKIEEHAPRKYRNKKKIAPRVNKNYLRLGKRNTGR